MICTRCGNDKPIHCFTACERNRPEGYKRYCLFCRKKYQTRYKVGGKPSDVGFNPDNFSREISQK